MRSIRSPDHLTFLAASGLPASTCVKDADFGLLRIAMRHRQIQTRKRRDEQRCARAGGGRDVCDAREPVRLLFLQRVEKSVAATDVQLLACRVVKQIVGVADDVEGAGLACRSPCRRSALSPGAGSRRRCDGSPRRAPSGSSRLRQPPARSRSPSLTIDRPPRSDQRQGHSRRRGALSAPAERTQGDQRAWLRRAPSHQPH